MELNDDTFAKIDDYLDGHLNEEARIAFEVEIKASAELREVVDMVRFEKKAGDYLFAKGLRTKVEEWEKETGAVEQKKPPKNSGWKNWLFGLIIIGLVAGLIYWATRDNDQPIDPPVPTVTEENRPIATDEETKNEEVPQAPEEEEEQIAHKEQPTKNKPVQQSPPQPDQYEELYAYVENTAYRTPSTIYDLQSRAEGEDRNPLEQAKKAFKEGKYSAALSLLEGIESTNKLHEPSRELTAHTYFKNRQFGKAAELFKSFSEKQNILSIKQEQYEWYWLLSLAADYANTNNQSVANQLLQKMASDEDHYYHSEANELNKQLEIDN